MKRPFLSLLVIVLFYVACSAPKKALDNGAVHDGSSYQKAIIINEKHERAGIDAEYAWIRQQYPGSKTRGQALMYYEKKPFDIIHILTSDSKAIDVYFDISKFYGKF